MMKRAFAVVVLLGACACVFAQNGIIKEVSGQVEIKNAGAADFVPASPGDTVRQDTVISTGFKSIAMIEAGSTQVMVRPLTRLTLTEIQASAGAETLNVKLQTGRVRVDVNPPAGTKTVMTVSSPMATASVRGTGFDFDGRNLKVNHGAVSFQGNHGAARIVTEGKESKVLPNGKPTNPDSEVKEGFAPSKPTGAEMTGGAGGVVGTASSGADAPGEGTIDIDIGF